ncbi:GAF domain-containing protein [Dendronalium sp. ChiSLP03b]|uniref:GAF domain-containing protein n=1 Tax=Dendronalium sp. ChiSLP03b TaxID=3075381 RepID=UPI002AD5710E|nr:GAF domain-containing protein [Dendronalium sp. ChiSLP03b]MDZ8203601.1 GAF domain-containing protein [Dendronalium sp. ChiSLP03b]
MSNTTSSLSTRLSISPTLQDALDSVLNRAIAIHRTDMGYIHLFEPKTSSLVIATQRGFRSDFVNFFGTIRIDDDYSTCARAMRAGESAIVEDIEVDSLYKPHRAIAALAGYRAVQSTPLTSRRGTLVGVLSTHFRQPRQFLPWEMNLFDMLARHAANLIELFQTDNVR